MEFDQDHRCISIIEQGGRTCIRITGTANTNIFIHTADGKRFSILAMFRNYNVLANRTPGPTSHLFHLFDKRTADHHFVRSRTVRTEHLSFNNRNLHQGKEIIFHPVHIGNIKQFAVISRKWNIISRHPWNRQVIAGRNFVNFGYLAQFLDCRITDGFFHTLCRAISQLLIGISGIDIYHIVILLIDNRQ